MENEVSEAVEESNMEMGSLQVLCQGQRGAFVDAVREASLCETAMLILEEDTEDRRILLQIGAISVS